MAIPKRDYVYDATMIEVIDGDTVQIELDLGCDSVIKPMRCRLSGINAKGKRTVEGKAAKALVEDLFPIGTPMRIETVKDKKEKYGRYLAVLYHPSLDVSVNDHLVNVGLAVPYNGVGKANDA
jgi:endonuclease YncB( thermonuclease family)